MCSLKTSLIIYSLVQQLVGYGSIPPPPVIQKVEIRKCCRENEFIPSDTVRCSKVSLNETSLWNPKFTEPVNKELISLQYHGTLACQSQEPTKAFQYSGSCDKLILLPDGKLRHYVLESRDKALNCKDEINDDTVAEYMDYNVSDYCIDMVVNWQNCVIDNSM